MDYKESSMRSVNTRMFFAAVISAAAFLCSVPAAVHAEKASAGRIASVNGTDLLRQDLDREMSMVKMRLTQQGRPVDAEQLKRYEDQIRDTLINRTLLLQQAQSLGIEANAALVTKAKDEFKAGFENDQAYQDALAEMGFSEAQLNTQIQDGLTIKALIDQTVTQQVNVTDPQVRAYYDGNPDQFRRPEQVKASHILIQVPEDASEAKKAEALATIQSLAGRIAAGEDFAALAQEYSDCPSKAKGGDLGFFGPEQMVPPFSQAAFALQPGQVSDVVETQFGYHLIRMTERQAPEALTFNDVKEEIATHLRQEQERTKIDDYLKQLTEKADIQRFPL